MRRHRSVAALLVVAISGVLTFGAVAPAQGDAIDDRRRAAEREKEKNEQQREDAEEAMEGVSDELAAASDRLLEIQAKIPGAQLALDRAQAAYDKARREALLIAARLEDAKEQETTLGTTITEDAEAATEMRDAIGQMAREAYRGGGGVSSMSAILDSESSEDFIERYGMVSTALRAQSKVLDELKASESANRNAQARLGAVKDRIVELKKEADAKVEEADEKKAAAAAAKQRLDDLLAEQKEKQQYLEAQKQRILQQIQEAEDEAKKIEDELKRAIEDQKKRDAARPKPPAAPAPISGAIFGNPTSTRPIHVTSEYGMRFHPVLHYWRMHAGIDLRAYCGTNIYAAREGDVLWTRYRAGYGNQVMISHSSLNGNGLASSYNHLSSFVVSPGQHVKAGQLIARSGNTGTSAACHLHFEVYINGATTNPRPYLGL